VGIDLGIKKLIALSDGTLVKGTIEKRGRNVEAKCRDSIKPSSTRDGES
jgi:hypothetical protein